MKIQLKQDLSLFGDISTISVDEFKKTAIVRFKNIESAKSSYQKSREIDESTGERCQILSSPNSNAQIIYVIPDVSKEDLLREEAAKNNSAYDPLQDENMTLEQVTRLKNETDEGVKRCFKEFCQAPADS